MYECVLQPSHPLKVTAMDEYVGLVIRQILFFEVWQSSLVSTCPFPFPLLLLFSKVTFAEKHRMYRYFRALAAPAWAVHVGTLPTHWDHPKAFSTRGGFTLVPFFPFSVFFFFGDGGDFQG